MKFLFQMATLSVHEAMGFKVDREAVATLVLPHLWAMSMGPCKLDLLFYFRVIISLNYQPPVLSVGQFQRFMSIIKRLGERVEREHDQFLRDSQRLEDRSGIAPGGATNGTATTAIDFENLVGRSNVQIAVSNSGLIKADNTGDDDVWGSILDDSVGIYLLPLRILADISLDLLSLPPKWYHRP